MNLCPVGIPLDVPWSEADLDSSESLVSLQSHCFFFLKICFMYLKVRVAVRKGETEKSRIP